MQDKPKSILTLLCLLALTSFMTGCASCREGFQELSRIDQEYRDGVMSALGTQMWLRNMEIEARNKELEDGPVISEDKMQVRNGLVYTVNQTEPFSGVVVGNYENG
ncbi:MAG: hypothetical protein VXY89_15640, partial [SAR324 cluster bacterium]|nr:hypothetical protein [SAR324 cluster bacterium]